MFTRTFLKRNNGEVVVKEHLLYSDSLILTCDKVSEDFLQSLGLVSQLLPKKSLIVINQPLSNWEILKQMLDNFKQNGLFYLAYPSKPNGTTMFFEAVTLINSSRAAIRQVDLDKHGHVIEDYNLQGIDITCIALPWSPMYGLKDCHPETGLNCHGSGVLKDHLDAMCRILNCSWDCQLQVDGNWGVAPDSGPFDKSGNWSGVMGSVVNNAVMMSVSAWAITYPRLNVIDFVVVGSKQEYLAYTPDKLDFDLTFFLRPFQRDSWIVIGFLIILVLLSNLLPYKYLNQFESTNGFMIASTTSWLFFVALNAFYGGALTMFFAVETEIVMDGMEDVLRDYPRWKLILTLGNEVYFQEKVASGEPLYVELWERVRNKPEETLYSTIEDGLAKIRKGYTAMFVEDYVVMGFFKTNPFYQQNVKLFGASKGNYYALMVNKGSPLKPILQKASNYLAEIGETGRIIDTWIGKRLPVFKINDEVSDLNVGQTVFVFFVIGATVLLCLILLFFEYQRAKSKYKKHKE